MKNLVIVSFPAKEGMMDNLKETLKVALPETRSFDGCISVETYVEESTDTIHLIEDWESLDHQAKYLNWRVETGLLDVLEPLLKNGASMGSAVLYRPRPSQRRRSTRAGEFFRPSRPLLRLSGSSIWK